MPSSEGCLISGCALVKLDCTWLQKPLWFFKLKETSKKFKIKTCSKIYKDTCKMKPVKENISVNLQYPRGVLDSVLVS